MLCRISDRQVVLGCIYNHSTRNSRTIAPLHFIWAMEIQYYIMRNPPEIDNCVPLCGCICNISAKPIVIVRSQSLSTRHAANTMLMDYFVIESYVCWYLLDYTSSRHEAALSLILSRITGHLTTIRPITLSSDSCI